MTREGYDPNQPRDEIGRWTDTAIAKAAEDAAGISPIQDVKKLQIKELPKVQGDKDERTQITGGMKENIKKQLAEWGWNVNHTKFTYPYKTDYYWDRGGEIWSKEDVWVGVEPFKDRFKIAWWTKHESLPLPYD